MLSKRRLVPLGRIGSVYPTDPGRLFRTIRVLRLKVLLEHTLIARPVMPRQHVPVVWKDALVYRNHEWLNRDDMPCIVHVALRRCLARTEDAQYTSGDYTQELTDHDVLGSIGTVGDALDNALAESYVDSYKTELIADRVWRSQAQVELATATWVAWFNHQRLHRSLGDIPPAEFEQNHARVALNASIPCNGSAAGIPSNAADGLTKRRTLTLGVDCAADRPISPRTVALLATGPAQAAPQAGQG
jgi:hypothetical protein